MSKKLADKLPDFDKYFGPDTPNGKVLAEIAAITDPMEALKRIQADWDYIGSDPYYREFNNALREMVDRIVK